MNSKGARMDANELRLATDEGGVLVFLSHG